MKSSQRFATIAIQAYQAIDGAKHQVLLSFFGFSSSCKHRPTCSQFAITQIRERGTILGLLIAFKRVLTCW